MTIPGAFLALLLSTTLGLAFHLLRGGGVTRLALYVTTAWATFFLGHFLGEWLDWRLLRVGTLNLFPAALASVLGLIVASFLAGPVPEGGRRRKRGSWPPAEEDL